MPFLDLGESKFYDFFKQAGWVDSELHSFGQVFSRQKNAESLATFCDKVISGEKEGDKKVAQKIIDLSPVAKQALLNGVVCEHVRRKLGAIGQSGFVNGVIEHFFRSSFSRESDIMLIMNNAPDLLEKSMKLLQDPATRRRIEAMLTQLEPDKLKEALSALIRTSELETHTWREKPAATHWESVIIRKIRELPIWQKFVFTGAKQSIWVRDSEKKIFPQKEEGLLRNELELAELRAIGGSELFLQNPDGEKIHTMEFDASSFQNYVRSALSKLEPLESGSDYKLPDVIPDEVQNLINLGIVKKMEDRLVFIKPQEGKKEAREPTTALMCTGSGVWFSVYKKMIARLLLNGVNVQTFSFRGYELSEGIPTDAKLSQDVETVGHYLREKGVTDENTLLFASCMGLGPAARYINNHPTCDLFIDRSFASLSAVAEDKIMKGEIKIPRVFRPLASKVARVALSLFVRFENLEALQNAQGKIAVVTVDEDEIVGENANRLKEGLPEALHIDASRFGHSGNWLHNEKVRTDFEKFLSESGHARNLKL